MKMFKRNAVIIVVLLFVCAAVYLNWSYGNNDTKDAPVNVSDAGDAADASSEASDPGDSGDSSLYYNDSNTKDEVSAYFDQVRLEREQARDAAAAVLQTASQTEGASQEAIDAAVAQIQLIAGWTMKEAELESLIMAKGFKECIVYISESGIKVTVPASETGLTSADVARITDVVTSETDFIAADLKINEIN